MWHTKGQSLDYQRWIWRLQPKKKKVECGEKMSGERKERVRKEECVGKVGEIP